jgi:hypothetical protein
MPTELSAETVDNKFVTPARDAAIAAAQRADECLAAGDTEGQAIWKRIVDAILGLLRDTPGEGERVN